MAKNKLSVLEERKKKLEEQIKEEKEKDLIKFAKWFYAKYDVDNNSDAKEIVSMFSENQNTMQ